MCSTVYGNIRSPEHGSLDESGYNTLVHVGHSVNGQSLENPFASAFRTSSAVLALLLGVSLFIFVPRLMLLLIPLGGAVLIWVVFRWPTNALGAVLAFMPIDFMVIALGKFFGLPYMTVVSVCDKEVPLLLLAFIFWQRNGFKPAAPDWFLLASLTIAAVHTVFDGTLVGLWTDFNFVIPYFVGRMIVLTRMQEQLWARCAVWIMAVLSVVGLVEVFIIGEVPRAVLYLAIGSEADKDGLSASFHGTGFTGLREAATTVGPNGFAVFCMIALILWWVYCRHPLPAGMIAVGLVCSLTRSAWLGTAVAIPLVAIVMKQSKRFFLYATLFLALFVASIPVLGIGDFLINNKRGQDESTESHQDDILSGLKFVAEHPFGAGNKRLTPTELKADSNTRLFETTYPQLSAEYGIPAVVLFIGFLLSALRYVWQQQTRLRYATLGILVGISIVMVVSLPLTDRRLACWVLFPIGLAVRSSISREASLTLSPGSQVV
jgi:hypothetical protein